VAQRCSPESEAKGASSLAVRDKSHIELVFSKWLPRRRTFIGAIFGRIKWLLKLIITL